MILKKFVDDLMDDLQTKLNDVAVPLNTILHEQVGKYHHGIGVIQGLRVAADSAQDLWKKYVSGDRDEPSQGMPQAPLQPEMPLKANVPGVTPEIFDAEYNV
jgi:hypothetical protein